MKCSYVHWQAKVFFWGKKVRGKFQIDGTGTTQKCQDHKKIAERFIILL